MHAYWVTFKSGYKLIQNRQNFEWNKTAFCEEFTNTITAGEFINVWNRITKVDICRHIAMPIIDYDSQSDV